MGKEKWQKLGYTPRQLSKKAGVTYSMAEFITQSYRNPLRVNCHKSQWRQKSPEKCNCTCNVTYKAQGEKLRDCPIPPVSCSRKRGRSKEEENDCDEHSDFSVSLDASEDSTACISSCKQSCNTSRKVNSSGKRKSNPGRKTAKCQMTMQCNCACPPPEPHQKKSRMIPINIHLDAPLNIFLDDEDFAELESRSQRCKKKKYKGTALQVPCSWKESSTELMSEECQRPEQSSGLQDEDSGDEEDETLIEECALNEDQSSSEKASCNKTTKATKAGCQVSWQEKIQDCLFFLEGLLNSLINKC